MDRRETERLLEVIRQARAAADPFALATVVRVRGSAYRREGTRMVVRQNGTYECALSGGCLEPAVAQAAARVIATGEPVIVSYDLADDSIWGLGIGCSGAVDIRIERLEDDRIASEWLEVLERGEAAVLVTPLSGVTGRMIVRTNDASSGALSNRAVEKEAVALAEKRLRSEHPWSSPEWAGHAEIFFEIATRSPEVAIFGAGDDTVPVAQLAWSLGFTVTVVDVREAPLTPERFPRARLVRAHESAVRNALRPILSKTSDDAGVFDQAFSEFFFPGPPGVEQPEQESVERALGKEAGQTEKRFPDEGGMSPPPAEEGGGSDAAGATVAPGATEKPEVPPPPFLLRAGYSPLEAEALFESPRVGPVASVWREAACLLVRRLHLGLLRGWRPATRGRRFDLRRTLRTSLQTGGEAITARWLRRPRRTPRFVLLIDGSRSMGPYAQTALQIAVAIASVTMRIEVFAFSTGLECITKDVRRAAGGEMRSLDRLQHAWAGGTTIGRCFREFIRRFGGRTTSRDTVLIIVSDGLDVGESDVLRGAMSELHSRSAGVVWLNPLIETPGYEPTAEGMRTARPYITTFSAANDVAGFARLSGLVRV